MIIGNNNNNSFPSEQERFNRRMNTIQENNQKNNNWHLIDNNPLKKYDVTNKNDMADKSLAMLQNRLNNGLISLDEFNRQCLQIEKQRQK